MQSKHAFYMVVVVAMMAAGFVAGWVMEPDAPQATATTPAIVRGTRVLVYEKSGCDWCEKFREDLAPVYAQTSYNKQAPLVYVQMQKQGDGQYALARPIGSTPTFVVVDGEGREVDRMVGYPRQNKQFYEFIARHL